MGSFFAYYKVEKYKNICHLQQNACNMLVDKQLERCRYLRQMRCRYFICNALYNQRKSLDSFVQSYGNNWSLYGEIVVSLGVNDSILT